MPVTCLKLNYFLNNCCSQKRAFLKIKYSHKHIFLWFVDGYPRWIDWCLPIDYLSPMDRKLEPALLYRGDACPTRTTTLVWFEIIYIFILLKPFFLLSAMFVVQTGIRTPKVVGKLRLWKVKELKLIFNFWKICLRSFCHPTVALRQLSILVEENAF